jgi:ElaB/YqjD/DUF883 family membrane-anchored ribosome-binding protein
MSATADSGDTGAKVRGIVADSTSKISSLGAQGMDQYRETAANLRKQLSRLQDDFADLQYAVSRNARSAARAADYYVRENPWRTAGLAALVAAVAVAVAMLASRRD